MSSFNGQNITFASFYGISQVIYIKICNSVTSCELGILIQFRSCNEEIKISKAAKD
jgi:hypothetical protein